MNQASYPPREVRKRSRRTAGRATGRFATRAELTAHVWSIRRHQLHPNMSSIASSCGATVGVVKTIIDKEEGLREYMKEGLAIGTPKGTGGTQPP